jgi:hypothetical protein
MFSGIKITAMLTREILEGSVAKGWLQWGIISTLLCCMVVEVKRGSMGMDITHWGMRYAHHQKIPTYHLRVL